LAHRSALGSWWGLVPAAFLCVAIVLRLLDEENYLAGNLPGLHGLSAQGAHAPRAGDLVKFAPAREQAAARYRAA